MLTEWDAGPPLERFRSRVLAEWVTALFAELGARGEVVLRLENDPELDGASRREAVRLAALLGG